MSAFTLGMLSLEERAEVDIHFDAICDRILDVGRVHGVTLPEELQPSTRPHSAMYHINLSGMCSLVSFLIGEPLSWSSPLQP